MANSFKLICLGILISVSAHAELLITMPAARVATQILREQKNPSPVDSSKDFLFKNFRSFNESLVCKKLLSPERTINVHQAVVEAPSWMRLALSSVFLNGLDLTPKERQLFTQSPDLKIDFNPYSINHFDNFDSEFFFNAREITPLEKIQNTQFPPQYSVSHIDYDFYRKQISFQITISFSGGIKRTTDVQFVSDQDPSKALAQQLIRVIRNSDLMGPSIFSELEQFRFDLVRLSRKANLAWVSSFVQSIDAILNHHNISTLSQLNGFEIFQLYFDIKTQFLNRIYPLLMNSPHLMFVYNLHDRTIFAPKDSSVSEIWAMDFYGILERPLYVTSDSNRRDEIRRFFRMILNTK